MENSKLINIKNVCRLCLSTDISILSVFEIFDDSPLRTSMADKIHKYLSIEILPNDKLSISICVNCIRGINNWHSYKESCLRSQETLHQWFSNFSSTSDSDDCVKLDSSNDPSGVDDNNDESEHLSEISLISAGNSNENNDDIEHIELIAEPEFVKVEPLDDCDIVICDEDEDDAGFVTENDVNVSIESSNSYKKRKRWNAEDMAAAVNIVRERKMSCLSAAKYYNVPKTTLFRLASDKETPAVTLVAKKIGRKPVFNEEFERQLVNYVLDMNKQSCRLTQLDLRRLAYQLADKNNMPHSFRSGLAGKHWLRGFLNRNRNVQLRRETSSS